jgi:hypothetical protein
VSSIQEVAEMLNGDVARYRTEDLLRVAEARRVGSSVVRRRRGARSATLRRIAATAAALLPVPIRH